MKNIKTKTFFLFVILLINSKLFANDKVEFLYFNNDQIQQIKTAITENHDEIIPFKNQLIEFADYMLDKGPWSVTFTPSKAISGNPNDYYSEGPYWWPDPNNPDGPYIRKDGIRNPERFIAHKQGLNNVYQSVFYLSMAAYFLDEQKYAKKAKELIRVWFIDDKTKMNPHLNYGQAIPNKSPGRGVGIIETHRYAKLIEGFHLLFNSGFYEENDQKELKSWFNDYLKWLTTSKNGLKEKNQGNNHTTWWCAQTAAFASFVNDTSILNMTIDHAKNFLIPHQIESDGSCPLEEERTLSLFYSMFNLNAYTLICRIAENFGYDLWQFTNEKGGNIQKAVQFIYPYFLNPSEWKKQQIKPLPSKEPMFLYFAGLRFNNINYIDTYNQRKYVREVKNLSSSTDPFLLLLNLYFSSMEQKDE